jgi:hypothetical protein
MILCPQTGLTNRFVCTVHLLATGMFCDPKDLKKGVFTGSVQFGIGMCVALLSKLM